MFNLKKTIFIKNAVILTVSSLLLRFAGIIFKVWLADNIGAEGIGLYQLIFSVYMLAATFATSGISTAVTRLCADELALGRENGVKRILFKSLKLTFLIAIISSFLLFFGAETISKVFLSDIRAVTAIKILSFSLPFMGFASCFKGYFIARRKASPTAFSQILEQIIRILLVMTLVLKFSSHGLEKTCAAVLFGDTVAELCSSVFLWLLYIRDKKNIRLLSGRSYPPFNITKEIVRIALPITSGRYLNTLLRTAENILVPKSLSKYPLASQNALSLFGMIKGMALPILFFPSTLLNALSTLLIPEMSEAATLGRKALVKDAVTRILQITALISFIFSGIFLVCGQKIGILIYKSEDVGYLLKMLSPIVPLMYLDSVSDGILKGLDQQLFTFRTALFDSAIRIILVIFILPRAGLLGFIGIMYFSNLLTCMLNVGRLLKVSGGILKPLKTVFLPFLSAIMITALTDSILSKINAFSNLVYITLVLIISITSYIAVLFAIKSISTDEIRDVIR